MAYLLFDYLVEHPIGKLSVSDKSDFAACVLWQ
jgi:hypothetical protein